MADIIIIEKFRTLIPPLNKAEYTELEKSLKKEGCREPLVTWNGYLIYGHNRFEILNIRLSICRLRAKKMQYLGFAQINWDAEALVRKRESI